MGMNGHRCAAAERAGRRCPIPGEECDAREGRPAVVHALHPYSAYWGSRTPLRSGSLGTPPRPRRASVDVTETIGDGDDAQPVARISTPAAVARAGAARYSAYTGRSDSSHERLSA